MGSKLGPGRLHDTPWDLNPGLLLPGLEAPLCRRVEIIQFPACHVTRSRSRNRSAAVWLPEESQTSHLELS